MKGKLIALAAISIALLALVCVLGFVFLGRHKDLDQYEKAVARARKVNLPTNANEFRRLLGEPDATNAFDAIARLGAIVELRRDKGIEGAVVTNENAHLPRIQSEYAEQLRLFDQAAGCDSYVATRKWEDGLVVLFPEFSETKRAARVVLGRARLALSNGDEAKALEDVRKLVRVASFLRTERHSIAHLVAASLEILAADFLLQNARRIDGEQAEKIFLAIRPPTSMVELYAGDCVMFMETVRAMCENEEYVLEILRDETKDPSARFSPTPAQESKIKARFLSFWIDFIASSTSIIKENQAAQKSYNNMGMALAKAWLDDGMPAPYVKVLESLTDSDAIATAHLVSAIRLDMYKQAFLIAHANAWLEQGSQVKSSPELALDFAFSRKGNDFILSHSGDHTGTIEVKFED